MSQQKLLLTIPNVAELLSLSVVTVKKRIADGVIPSVKEGGSRRVRPADLEAYVNGLPLAQPADADAA